MKCIPAAAATLVLSAFAAQALPAGSSSPSAFSPQAGPGHAQQYRKAQAVKALRREGLKLQAADGGTLSEAHRTELQRKLDGILAGNY